MTAPVDRAALIALINTVLIGDDHDWFNDFTDWAEEILEAIEAAGCRVVPLEPTQGMEASVADLVMASVRVGCLPVSWATGFEEMAKSSPYRPDK